MRSFYSDKGNNDSFWISMRDRFDEYEVQNLLILLDNEGHLGDKDNKLRKKAIENHYKRSIRLKLCIAIQLDSMPSEQLTLLFSKPP